MNKYFTYDPEDNVFETYATLAEQSKAAERIIAIYLGDEGWEEEVEGIVSGIITETATMCDIVKRSNEINDEGYDKEGRYWPKEYTWLCNVKMVAI